MRPLYHQFLLFIPVTTRPLDDMSYGRKLPSLTYLDLDHGRIVTSHLVIGQKIKRPCFQNILNDLSQTLKTTPAHPRLYMDCQMYIP